jgi:pentatricopeptide repeat protein
MVTLAHFIKTAGNRFVRTDYKLSSRSRVMGPEAAMDERQSRDRDCPAPPPASFNEVIGKCKNGTDLETAWSMLQANRFLGQAVENYSMNKLMTAALALEKPEIAVRMFEQAFGYHFEPANPAKDALKDRDFPELTRGGWDQSALSTRPVIQKLGAVIEPNNFVCSTAIKAYGRLGAGRLGAEKALGVVPWLESKDSEKADIYTLSSLLYVCAKHKKVAEAERIFWETIPARKLNYTIATTNSLMYMYAKLNRADDALRVYEVTKSLQIKCTIVTFGVLIKALLSSGKKQLETTSYDILASLSGMGIVPGVDIYNQFLEHYAKTHDYKGTRKILNLMSQSKPRVKPDLISYGYVITCFAGAKKPKATLSVYHQMKLREFVPNGYVYMGVLKALATQRDGSSAVQVITEMRELGVVPDKRHISMAMFACVISDVNNLAESLLALYVRSGNSPDTALYTLLLRALLQQNKWKEGYSLLKRMSEGSKNSQPNFITMNYLLKSQVAGGRFDEALDTLLLILRAIALKEQNLLFEPWQEVRTGVDGTVEEKLTAVPKISPSNIMYSGESPQGILEDSCFCLSYCLGTFSRHVNKVKKQDSQLQTRSYGYDREDSPKFDSVDLREFGFPLEESLQAPSAAALEFLVNCAIMIAAQEGALLPGEFYLELLQALVSGQASSELTARLLDIGQTQSLRVKRTDMIKVSKAEDLARRAIQGRRSKSSEPFVANVIVNEKPSSSSSSQRRGKIAMS